MSVLALSLEAVATAASASATTLARQDLASFAFLAPDGGRVVGENHILLPFPLLREPALQEYWRTDTRVSHARADGNVALSFDENFLLLHASEGIAASGIQDAGQVLYQRLLSALGTHSYPNIVKCWNAVPDINREQGDDEIYKQFCVGRAEAFAAADIAESNIPAGTAVGTAAGEELSVCLLATHLPVQTIENPRQISAYRYPRQYGPRSPSFARAAKLLTDKHTQLFISGTAAIAGHESLHPNDIPAQMQEIRRNLDALLEAADMDSIASLNHTSTLDAVMRLYVRDPSSAAVAMESYWQSFPELGQVSLLQADICRRDLDVELDGVFTAPR